MASFIVSVVVVVVVVVVVARVVDSRERSIVMVDDSQPPVARPSTDRPIDRSIDPTDRWFDGSMDG
jgi:hypothetical protein